jgi:hypothetical protein
MRGMAGAQRLLLLPPCSAPASCGAILINLPLLPLVAEKSSDSRGRGVNCSDEGRGKGAGHMQSERVGRSVPCKEPQFHEAGHQRTSTDMRGRRRRRLQLLPLLLLVLLLLLLPGLRDVCSIMERSAWKGGRASFSCWPLLLLLSAAACDCVLLARLAPAPLHGLGGTLLPPAQA